MFLIEAIQQIHQAQSSLTDELQRLARIFKVSTLVVLRRVHDSGYMDDAQYWEEFHAELQRVLDLMADGGGGGGNFYNTQPLRISRRFARAVITSAAEGQTSYRDAFRMLGVKKTATFQELSNQLGIS